MGAAKKLLDKKVLKELVPLNALSAVHLDEISRKAEIETIRSGRYVFKAGDRDQKSVYLLEGKVELLDNARNVVSSVTGGSEAAHHPLAHKQPRQLSARASGAVTIARVDSGLLDVLLTWDESSGYDVVEIGAEDDGDWMTRMLQSQAFLQLPPSNIHQLLMRLEPVNFRAGDVVVRQDEDGDYFYIVKSGRMAVSRKASARSKDVLLAELGEGACFGEEALVSGSRRNATVTMLTDGALMRLSREDFNELLRAPLVHEVEYAQARKLADEGAEWLDVRLPGEFDNQHIRDSRNFPLSALREQADSLDSDKHYIVCCDTGRRSASGAFILRQRGFSVYTLKNGLMDVPGEVLNSVPDPSQVDAVSLDADIIPFESDRGSEDKTAQAPQQDEEAAGRLEEQLHASEAAHDALQAEAETLREQVASLEVTLDETEKKHSELARQLGEVQQGHASSEEAREQFEKQRAQLESELERVREDYQQLGQRTSAVAGERDAANRELEKARGELEALQARLDSQQGEISEQVRVLQEQVETKNRELETGVARCNDLEATLADAEKAASAAAERETELVAQVERLAGIEQQLAQSQADEQALTESLEAARQQAEEAEQRIRTELQQEHDALSTEIADLREALSGQDQLAKQLQERDQALVEAAKHLDEVQQQLVSREREFDSDLGSAREAMARAQTEVDNLKREQQRLLDRLRKMEETRDRERHDHEAEIHRLHKEMQSAVNGSAEGLAAELEALQAQINENTRLRDDLEVSLGERSAQLEEAQGNAEQLEQQLKLAQQSAREAEQQLVEATRLANEEMEVRLNTEQGIQQGLREALEASERERNGHQETITVITQELEELREAYQQSKQALEGNEDAASRLGEVQAQLDTVQAERDALMSSADALKNELDQLRAEAEVHRGLEGMLSDDEDGSIEDEALQQAKQNVEVAVRLRTQAEEQVERLRKEVEQLRTQLSSAAEAPAPAVLEGAIPSLDNSDPHASNPMLPDVPDIEEDVAPEAVVLLDDEPPIAPPASVQTPKSGLVKGLLAGLIVGAATGAGLFWWQAGPGQPAKMAAGVEPATQPAAGSEKAPEQVKQPEAKVTKASKVPLPGISKSDVKQTVQEELPAASNAVDDTDKPAPVASESTSATETITTVSRSFPLSRGMPEVPRSSGTRIKTTANGQEVSIAEKGQVPEQTEEKASVTSHPVADVNPEPDEEPVVEQPAGRFRDRLSDGGAGPAMVRLRADRFLMGSSVISQQFDERPQHEVRLGSFAIAAHEITFNDYDVFARATGRRLPDDKGWGRGERPVINVSWEDAQAYTQWLSGQTGKQYRLPTEAEWEFVARSGVLTRYWWGESVGDNQANCFDCGSADGGIQTSRVGSFAASPWGVYDMAGNVREWVKDCYTPNYSRAPADGRAVETAGCAERVVRGGAYSSPSAQLRSTSRDRMDAQSRLDNLGFRVVRNP